MANLDTSPENAGLRETKTKKRTRTKEKTRTKTRTKTRSKGKDKDKEKSKGKRKDRDRGATNLIFLAAGVEEEREAVDTQGDSSLGCTEHVQQHQEDERDADGDAASSTLSGRMFQKLKEYSELQERATSTEKANEVLKKANEELVKALKKANEELEKAKELPLR